MAVPADFNLGSATHENFEMNARKHQTPSSKLQGSSKHQAVRNRILELGIWDFFGAWCLVFGALGLFSLSASASQPSISLSGLPLFFEPQESVMGEASGFLARGQNYQFAITATGAEIVLSKAECEQNELSGQPSRNTQYATRNTHNASRAIQMQILGANPYAPMHGDGLLSGKMNYLIGNDPSQWRTGLPVFSKVQVDDIYPGVNLIYYGNQNQLEYDFVIAPHARPDSIALHFDGADNIEVNKEGELVLSLGSDEIRFHRPAIYQEVRGARQPISGGYQFEDARTVTFSVGQYDHNLPLIIDPVLAYSGYFGGKFGDVALGVKVDSSGNVYIAGETLSRTNWPFPLSSSVTNHGGRFIGDAFVAKISNDPLNPSLIYFTYIGGSEDDGALDLALDNLGNPYITGFTDSTNFPTLNAAFPNISGFRDPTFHTYPTDAFVAELSPVDGSLIYSTYLGGSRADVGGAITVDSNRNVYVTGYTYSTNFPMNSGVFTNIQSTLIGYTNGLMGSNDIFVAKIAPDGQGLKYVTLFGGAGLDEGEGIAADDSDHVYVCGYTGSTNFYTVNGLLGTNGLAREINGVTNAAKTYRGVRHVPFDAFLARFDTTKPGPDSVEYSTLFGGKFNDAAFRMVLYTNTDVIITGNSRSPDFPTNNLPAPLRSHANAANADAFLIRFHFDPVDINLNHPSIFYSTLFGGSSEDIGWDLALDPLSGNVYVVGITSSGDFPSTNGVTPNGAPNLRTNHIALRDVFVTAFSKDASAILYSVQIGGNKEDFGYGIAVDSVGSAYIVGRTVSVNFPAVTNASTVLHSKRIGTNDAFLAKILAGPAPAPPPPALKTKLAGSGIQLAWPNSSSGYVLESNTNLANPAGWVAVSGFPITTNNGALQVQVPMTNGSLFFRLRK
jgi:Beta-propeller repeat